jgi:hypothetical protein
MQGAIIGKKMGHLAYAPQGDSMVGSPPIFLRRTKKKARYSRAFSELLQISGRRSYDEHHCPAKHAPAWHRRGAVRGQSLRAWARPAC